MKRMETLRMPAVLENVPLVIDCVTQLARTAGFDSRALYEIQLAVDEAFANVVHHAYQGAEPGEIEISCLLDEDGLTVQVRDWGTGFDPDNVEEPDVEACLEDRTLGGLGLFLVKQVMDDVEFTCDEEVGNELSMTKRLQVAD